MIIIYINEAHATDVWNIGESAGSINKSHKTIEDRIHYAKEFQQRYNVTIPIYCDTLDTDNVETLFASWPTRYFIVGSDHKLLLIGEPQDSELNIDKLMTFVRDK